MMFNVSYWCWNPTLKGLRKKQINLLLEGHSGAKLGFGLLC